MFRSIERLHFIEVKGKALRLGSGMVYPSYTKCCAKKMLGCSIPEGLCGPKKYNLTIREGCTKFKPYLLQNLTHLL